MIFYLFFRHKHVREHIFLTSSRMNLQALALHGHMKPVTMVKFNREGDLIFSVAKEPTIAVWNAKTGERLGTYNGGHSAVAACDVNQCSTMLATAGFDLKTILWNVETGEMINSIMHLAPARACGFSHDDKLLMVVTDKKMQQPGRVQLFNLPKSLSMEHNLSPAASYEQPEAISYAEWGPTNGKIYAGNEDGSVIIIDAETMREVSSNPSVHKETIRRVHFDPNYQTLITCSTDKTAALLDPRSKLQVIQRYLSDVPVNDASISPSGDQVILGGGIDAQDVTVHGGQSKFEVKFYHKVHGGEPLGQIKCHFGTINTVQFHPSGRGFASGAVDGFIKVYSFDETYDDTPGAVPLWRPPQA